MAALVARPSWHDPLSQCTRLMDLLTHPWWAGPETGHTVRLRVPDGPVEPVGQTDPIGGTR
eukprot:1210272-Amphidinium_carterae.1